MSSSRSLSVRHVIVSDGPQLVIEDASIGSGAVVDARLTGVTGSTYSDAEAKLKGRCFGLADDVEPLLAQALRAIGQPDATSARLQTRPVRDMLTGSMPRRLLPWVAVGCLITFAGIRSMCTASPLHRDRVHFSTPTPTLTRSDVHALARRVEASHARVVSLETRRVELVAQGAALESKRVQDRCEPLEWPLCPKRGALCSPMADGTERHCRRRTRSHGAVELVCVPGIPSRSIKQWRRARLRTIVKGVCSRGCNTNKLTNYMTVLADRETDRRPWKRHRLDVDRESAAKAWRQHASMYKQSPAHGEPWRWATGLGYYGQNPALWLSLWDASAEPEALCGEVESTLVHLRGARRRLRQLSAGVECDGAPFHGSSESGAPSWYDVSLVNSGSKRCPAKPGEGKRWKQRLSFERRAASFGLDPYEAITLSMLGEVVERDEQVAFAAELYVRLSE